MTFPKVIHTHIDKSHTLSNKDCWQLILRIIWTVGVEPGHMKHKFELKTVKG